MSCLWALLQSGLATYEQLTDILDEILTKVKCLLRVFIIREFSRFN